MAERIVIRNGVVAGADALIESQLLGLWYREGADGQWTQTPADHSIVEKSFTSSLLHFCEFAIAW